MSIGPIHTSSHATSHSTRMDLYSGLLLMFATILALIFANQPFLYEIYSELKDLSFSVGFIDTHWRLTKPLLLWINDGLIVIFFLLVGLELKREMVAGQFKNKKQMILPAMGALGGVVVPAIIYLAFNFDTLFGARGWAIPTATDTAFVLGILALISRHIPLSLRLFLLMLAIFDDVAAISVIALFYTHHLSWLSLFFTSLCISVLLLMNYFNVRRIDCYVVVGLVMWVFLLKSGVHATLSGVILGFIIPYQIKNHDESPLVKFEHALKPWVYFFTLPVFAFINAGIVLTDTTWGDFLNPITMGIAMGLFLGKQIGVFGFSWVVIRCGFSKLPHNCSWRQLYGGAVLCGVGFTMSLFIASLSFDTTGMLGWDNDRLGILLGSLLSGVLGYIVLCTAKSPHKIRKPS